MKKTRLLLLIMVCFLCTAGCGGTKSPSAKEKYSATRWDLFDTAITLTGYAGSKEEFDGIAQKAFDELALLNRFYDAYHEYSGITNICTLNASAGTGAQEVDSRITDLLSLAKEISDVSGGKVDVTAGSVLKLWHDARTAGIENPEKAQLPEEQALIRAKAHTGFDKLETDAKANTVRLTDPEALLDVGSIAKGYAVERVRQLLPEGYLISAGGNVCATGPKPDGTGWTVGIQDPDGTGAEVICTLSIDNGSVVTSGDYQRYYTVDGVRYHHIIDLDTLKPANLWHSVTVVCDDSGIADGLSTALFLLSKQEGEKLLKNYGADAVWIDPDGNIQYTENLKTRLNFTR